MSSDGFTYTIIGTKIIKAEPMDEMAFITEIKNSEGKVGLDGDGNPREGYLVIYDSGYKSWSPKEVFEVAYREITEGEAAIVDNK